jgi:hypothetical protein
MAASTVEKVSYHTVTIDNTSINFPFKPYDLQVDYMRKVLECVREGREGGTSLYHVLNFFWSRRCITIYICFVIPRVLLLIPLHL